MAKGIKAFLVIIYIFPINKVPLPLKKLTLQEKTTTNNNTLKDIILEKKLKPTEYQQQKQKIIFLST